jgi:hypothetical protein
LFDAVTEHRCFAVSTWTLVHRWAPELFERWEEPWSEPTVMLWLKFV